jgi:hypothetical protein
MKTVSSAIVYEEPDRRLLEHRRMTLDAGYLGAVFGGSAAPTNIAGVVVFVLLLIGALTVFFKSELPPLEYWKIATPIITGALGFVFGRKV